MTPTESELTEGKRVRHKSGLTGRIVSITEWVYVLIDESRTVVPYYAGSLEVIKGGHDGT